MEVVSLYPRNLSVLSWTASFLNKLGVLISSPQPSHSHVKTDTRPVLFASELKFSSKLYAVVCSSLFFNYHNDGRSNKHKNILALLGGITLDFSDSHVSAV